MLGVLFTSVIYGVIYNETNKSIFAVILFNYIGNLTGETFVITSNAGLISTGLRGLVALFIILCFVKKEIRFLLCRRYIDKGNGKGNAL